MNMTPDPIELARRLAADRMCVALTEEVETKEEDERQRTAQIMAKVRPLQEITTNAMVERRRLLRIVRNNDRKIRTAKEQANRRPNDLLRLRRALAKRQEVIKERYVKTLITMARNELNRTLPINPVLVPKPKPKPI